MDPLPHDAPGGTRIGDAASDPRRALAVAATYVVGFRAALSARPLPRTYTPDDPGVGLVDALESGPDVAAAAAWHAHAKGLGEVATELATRASVHEDAHLVKYTLACLDSAAADPNAARLFYAAAASLVAYWQA